MPLYLVVVGLKRSNCNVLSSFQYPQKYSKQSMNEGARSDGISYAVCELGSESVT